MKLYTPMKLRQILESNFSSRMKKNPRYSLRAFARFLSVDPSALSEILRGKRKITVHMAKKILLKVELPSDTTGRDILEELAGLSQKANELRQISNAEFALISSWEHFAILSLLEIASFNATPSNFASRLNIPQNLVQSALKNLETLNLVSQLNSRWSLVATEGFATSSDVPNSLLRAANKQYIEKALESLECDAIRDRDITGITMAIDAKKIDNAKKLIRNFRRTLSSTLEKGERSEVYRLNVQLFPLSKVRKR